MKLLLIEDHQDIAGVIYDYFEMKGHTVDHAYNGKLGFELCIKHQYDIIILDIMLPKMNGLELCQEIRHMGIVTPVIMLTARDNNDDILEGFEHGADDYLVKPFDLKILEARVSALMRRKEGTVAQNNLSYFDIQMDLKKASVVREGQTLNVNITQFKILKMLLMRAPNLVSKEELINEIWPDEEPESSS